MTLPAGALHQKLAAWVSVDPHRAFRQLWRLAHRLPLVHRTGGHPSRPWREIFEKRAIERDEAQTAAEREAGHSPVVYFFLGSAAYRKGSVALLFENDEIIKLGGTFTPIDSGGLCGGWMCRVGSNEPLTAQEGATFYQDHHAASDDLPDFAAAWIAAHFSDPMDYVRRGLVSEPDDPPAHGFRSHSGHRLAWTLELQCAQDVPLDCLQRLLLARRALLDELPDEFLDIAEAPAIEMDETDFTTYVAAYIERRLQEPA